MSQRAERAAKRAELLGVGPASSENEPGRWPGITGKLSLAGEVFLVGVFVSVLSIPVVTIPLAFAVGTRHLRRYLRGESSSLALAGRDLKRAILCSLPVGLLLLAILTVLGVDLSLAQSGAIAASGLIEVLGWVAIMVLVFAMLGAARLWSPELGWRGAFRGCRPSWRADPVGAAYLLTAVGVAVIVSLLLIPLAVPGVGCLILLALVIPERGRTSAPREIGARPR